MNSKGGFFLKYVPHILMLYVPVSVMTWFRWNTAMITKNANNFRVILEFYGTSQPAITELQTE